jgi:hypothetical protein
VAAIEETADVFKVVMSEGVSGLWQFIQEKLEDLKSMVMDAVFDFIKERVLIAGVTWIISLLNPASAFFKACKAIYDIVKFFIERGSQILALVNAIIDSIAAIAKGSLDTAAKWVEDALAKTIPVAIGFLAALLNLGDISATIKGIIDKAQEPVNKAIDWVIGMAVKGVKAVGNLLGGGEKKEARTGTESGDPVHDAKVTAGLSAIGEREAEAAPEGRPSLEVAEAIAEGVRKDHPVFTSIHVVDGGDHWIYHWTGSEGIYLGHPIPEDILALIKRLELIPETKGAERLIKILAGKLTPNMRKGYVFQAQRTLYWNDEGLLVSIEYRVDNLSTSEVSVFDIVIDDPEGAHDDGKRMTFYVDTKNWEKTTELMQKIEEAEAKKDHDPKKWAALNANIELRLRSLRKRLDKYRRLNLDVVIEWRGDIPQRIEALNEKRTETLGSIKIISIPKEEGNLPP